jgi:hypothetical protein
MIEKDLCPKCNGRGWVYREVDVYDPENTYSPRQKQDMSPCHCRYTTMGEALQRTIEIIRDMEYDNG